MENEQGLLSGLVSEYDLGDLSEEEEEGEDLHRTDEDQDRIRAGDRSGGSASVVAAALLSRQ